jgi:hypothetical protein
VNPADPYIDISEEIAKLWQQYHALCTLKLVKGLLTQTLPPSKRDEGRLILQQIAFLHERKR